jgi:hypothetical protein
MLTAPGPNGRELPSLTFNPVGPKNFFCRFTMPAGNFPIYCRLILEKIFALHNYTRYAYVSPGGTPSLRHCKRVPYVTNIHRLPEVATNRWASSAAFPIYCRLILEKIFALHNYTRYAYVSPGGTPSLRHCKRVPYVTNIHRLPEVATTTGGHHQRLG